MTARSLEGVNQMPVRSPSIVPDAPAVPPGDVNAALLDIMGQILAHQTAQTAELAAVRKLIERKRTISVRVSPLGTDDDAMTVGEAAEFARCDRQTIRNWCKSESIGVFDAGHCRWLVSKSKLTAYMERRFGSLPARAPSQPSHSG